MSILDRLDSDLVQRMFPHTRRSHIESNLPFVLDGLRVFGLDEEPIVKAGLATIRAEVETFEPISEYQSKWNTSPGGQPYDRYDFRHDLGNGARGDGAKYKGRGYIQLTGKNNYRQYGGELLLHCPHLANDAKIAGLILASFLYDRRDSIRTAMQDGHYRIARRLVNGGSHGLERFVDAIERWPLR